jgi:hypothetical protein
MVDDGEPEVKPSAHSGTSDACRISADHVRVYS